MFILIYNYKNKVLACFQTRPLEECVWQPRNCQYIPSPCLEIATQCCLRRDSERLCVAPRTISPSCLLPGHGGTFFFPSHSIFPLAGLIFWKISHWHFCVLFIYYPVGEIFEVCSIKGEIYLDSSFFNGTALFYFCLIVSSIFEIGLLCCRLSVYKCM